jgi:NAD(P)-dependent dehydrogenase (short-subunit alcohol dehydrogenase family)
VSKRLSGQTDAQAVCPGPASDRAQETQGDIVSLSGKNCLVTGANSGLGFAVSEALADMDANTIMLCRDADRGARAVQQIRQEVPNASLDLMICDLSSISSVRRFVTELKGKYSSLDVLFNNAGVMKRRREVTEDGLEIMFQVNYLAAFMLMNDCLELLRNGTAPLIINNARPADKYRLDLDDLESSREYSMFHSFFRTKLCLLLAGLELSQRAERNGVAVTMIVPGSFKSRIGRDMPAVGWAKNLFSMPADAAAGNIIYHITNREAEDKNGRVFTKRQEDPLTDYWQDASVRERLWSATESLLRSH